MLLLLRSLWLVFKTLTGVFLWWRSSTSWYWGKIKNNKKKNSQTEILQYFLSISQAMRVYLLTRLLWWTDVPWPKNSQHFDQCIKHNTWIVKIIYTSEHISFAEQLEGACWMPQWHQPVWETQLADPFLHRPGMLTPFMGGQFRYQGSKTLPPTGGIYTRTCLAKTK